MVLGWDALSLSYCFGFGNGTNGTMTITQSIRNICGKTIHKIGLYADDIMLIMSHLMTACNTKDLGEISYYRVIERKSQVLGFNVSSTVQYILQEHIPMNGPLPLNTWEFKYHRKLLIFLYYIRPQLK